MENVYNETYLWNLRRIKGTKTIFRGPDPKLYKEDDRIFTFLEKNNIKTVIDLRGEYEASSGQDFREELIKRGIEAPVVNLNEPPNTSDSSPGYVKKLTHRSDQIAEMLRYIIKGKGNSLIHCHSGKDRTGVSSALLMKIMGLSDKESIEEYTKTGLDARPTRIIPVLKYLEKQQNGALNYLKHIGLTEEEIEALNKK
jgi:protein tyrosine/serine phosphatase